MADTHVRKFVLVPKDALKQLSQSNDEERKALSASTVHRPHVPADVSAVRVAQQLIEFLTNKELTDRPVKLGIHEEDEDPAVRAVQNAEIAQGIAAALNQIRQQRQPQQQRWQQQQQPHTPEPLVHVRRLFDPPADPRTLQPTPPPSS